MTTQAPFREVAAVWFGVGDAWRASFSSAHKRFPSFSLESLAVRKRLRYRAPRSHLSDLAHGARIWHTYGLFSGGEKHGRYYASGRCGTAI